MAERQKADGCGSFRATLKGMNNNELGVL
jgi:hypothetical protein